jgi:hypothetical protein
MRLKLCGDETKGCAQLTDRGSGISTTGTGTSTQVRLRTREKFDVFEKFEKKYALKLKIKRKPLVMLQKKCLMN